MRILVIGGTRFIGPEVVRQLAAAGHEVLVFHRGGTPLDPASGAKDLHGDRNRLADFRGDFRRFGPEVVVDMIPFFETQARALMDAFRGLARRVVAVSSADVYRAYDVLHGHEDGPEPLPITEASPLRARLYPYRGKGIGLDDYEKILVERRILGDPRLPGTVLRLPMVYGPGDPQHRIHPYLKRMDDGRPAILLEAGFAAWRGPRGYVADAARAIALAATDDRAAGQIYNVAEPEAPDEAAWVRRIGRAAGWAGRIEALPPDRLPPHLNPGFRTTQDWILDSAKIRGELGYREAVPPDEALERTVAWERAHPPASLDPGAFDYAAEESAMTHAP